MKKIILHFTFILFSLYVFSISALANQAEVQRNNTIDTNLIVFSITDIDNIPIVGAIITLGITNDTTDIDGKAYFYLVNGNYTYTIKRPGYIPVSSTQVIISNEDITLQIKMTAIIYNVYFNVYDSVGTIGSASVTVGSTTNLSSGAGLASFLLTTGSYTYNVTKQGYYSIPNKAFNLVNDTTINVKMSAIPPTVYSIMFKVSEDTMPLSNVMVTIDTNTISTSSSGEALFTLPNGTYTYMIVKSGFDTIFSTEFKVKGMDSTLTIVMNPDLFPVIFTVTNGSKPIVGAAVIIDTERVYTDSVGVAKFMISNGYFSYQIVKSGYTTINLASFVISNSGLDINTEMFKAPVGNINSDDEIRVFPNPTSDLLHFSGVALTSTEIRIYAITGELILACKATDTSYVIDMSHYPKGNYIIQLISGSNIKTQTITVI